MDRSTCGWNGGAPPFKSKQLRSLEDLLCWNLRSIDVYDTLQQWCMCMTDFSPYRSLNRPPRGVAIRILCVCDNVVQVQEVWRYRHGTNFRPGSYGCPTIGEAEVSSYNSMSACKSTFESSGVGVQFDAHDMVWTAWNAKWQVGSPRGTVWGYPLGSWSLPMIWKLCHGLCSWYNMRICRNWISLCAEIVQRWYEIGMKCFWFAHLQSKFILMWLHHMLWCGVLGEDYDGF